MFVPLIKIGDNGPTRGSFNKHCMSLVGIKEFNALIDKKLFFDQPVTKKKSKKRMKNLLKSQEIMTTQQGIC